jgi:general secretion pathway protein A
MYLSHYNLASKPFQMSTDPGFLWLGEKHKEALATLRYSIIENKGILALTGDVGTGKTTLINALIQSLGDDTLVATIYDPSLRLIEFYNIICNAFNIEKTFNGKGEFLIYFKWFLKEVRAQNKKVLLIIDESQRMNNELLEEIRLLSNLEDEYIRLLNIFFVGQNEFIDTLKEYKNRALRQRIALNYHIKPLTLNETEDYIRHRLEIAGAKTHIFSSGAIQEVFSFSSGYPRLINIICDHALLTGYVREIPVITQDIIKECNEELQISNLNMGQNTYISDDDSESIR